MSSSSSLIEVPGDDESNMSVSEAIETACGRLKETGLISYAPLLPMLFRLHGKPYTIEKYAPTEPMFDRIFPPKRILIAGRQVSKTSILAALEVIYCSLIPYFNILHVTPLFEMVRKYSTNYVRELINTSPIQELMQDKGRSKQVLQRSFPQGGSIYFSYALKDATRTRGIPAKGNVFDEIQDMHIDVIELVEQTMGGSPYGDISIYAGTPKSTDNTASALFGQSSQGEWCIKCDTGGCGHWNVPLVSHDMLDMIGPVHAGIGPNCAGLVCAKCRKPLRPESGQWVHMFAERLEGPDAFAGYHMPQPIMSIHYESPVKWSTLVHKTAGDNVSLMNEVLGEACDQGTKLVSQAELRAAACLPWSNKLLPAKERIHDYEFRLLAIDWGGGGGKLSGDGNVHRTSFTAFAVLGYKSDGTIDVLFGFRSLKTNDHIYEARMAVELFSAFRCRQVSHDVAGIGGVRETLMISGGIPRHNILAMQHTSRSQGRMVRRPAPEGTDRIVYSLDKTVVLATVCLAIKRLSVRFFQYDYVGPNEPGLLNDFLALIEEVVNSRFRSDVLVIQRNPTLSDDFAQAVTYGCCAIWEMTGSWPADLAGAERFRLPADILREITTTEFDSLERELDRYPQNLENEFDDFG